MAIVNIQPDSEEIGVEHSTLPEAIQEPSKSIISTLVPESTAGSLLKYSEGYPWSIVYYGQIINVNNSLLHFDPTAPNLTQPYYKVFDVILQVSSQLSSSYDQESGVTTVSGTAITPYKLIPNAGDVFIAKVDTGNDAIFIINSVSRLTYRKDTLYEINYNLYSYTSANQGFVSQLESRVQDTYYFNKDTNYFNRDVLIKPSVKEAIDRLSLFMLKSKKEYMTKFIQPITGTLAIPGVNHVYLDPLLINFIMHTVEYDYDIMKLSEVDLNRVSMYKERSIWDALLSRDKLDLEVICKQYKYIPSSSLNNSIRLGTAFYAKLDYVICPLNLDISRDIKSLDCYPVDSMMVNNPVEALTNSRAYNRSISTVTGNLELLHPVYGDNYYLVTKNFYDFQEDPTIQVSFMELLVHKFINQLAISKEDLVVAVNDYSKWSLLHQLYLLPVVWHIIRNT